MKISGLSLGIISGYYGSERLVTYLFFDLDNNKKYLNDAVKSEFGGIEPSNEVVALNKIKFLDFSKSYKIDEKKYKMIYFNGNRSQGHKGVTHGGYTFSISNLIGLDFIKKENLSPPTKTFTRYTKPSYIGKEHHATSFINQEGFPCVEITDKEGNLISFTIFQP